MCKSKECGHKKKVMGADRHPLTIAKYEESLAAIFPEVTRMYRGKIDPWTIKPKSNYLCEWECDRCANVWPAPVNRMTRKMPSGCNGCPECGKKIKAEKLATAKRHESLAAIFPEVTRMYRGKIDPWTIKPKSDYLCEWECDRCANVWPAPVNRMTRKMPSGCNGCPECGKVEGKKKMIIAPRGESLAALFPELTNEYRGSRDPWSIYPGSEIMEDWLCSKCGIIYPAPPSTRTGLGSGCPHCSKGGHDRTSPSFVYLLYRPGQIQYGIMNTWTNRLKQHARKGWWLLDKIEVTGRKARSLETKIKRTLKAKGIPAGREAFREKFEGYTESFQEVDLSVRSIQELCQSLGIDLDAFLAA